MLQLAEMNLPGVDRPWYLQDGCEPTAGQHWVNPDFEHHVSILRRIDRSAAMRVALPPGIEPVVPQVPTGVDGTGRAGSDQAEGDHGRGGHTKLVFRELARFDHADDQVGDANRDLRVCSVVEDESLRVIGSKVAAPLRQP